MSKRAPPYQIYPKRFFDASPTWFKWNALTAADVHALRTEQAFEGQHVYFHLNHPIRFVRLVGIVAEIAVHGGGKYLILSMDDSSGACIDLKTTVRQKQDGDTAVYPSNTIIDNLDVHVGIGQPIVSINKQPIALGTVVKAKGTITSYYNTRQLQLERIWVVEDTEEEVKAWSEIAKWKRDVLSQPWVLTKAQRDEIHEKAQRDALIEAAASKKWRKRNAKYKEHNKRRLEKMEEKRKRDELEYNAGALLGSNVIPARVTDS